MRERTFSQSSVVWAFWCIALFWISLVWVLLLVAT
jgi:hypothetical protein